MLKRADLDVDLVAVAALLAQALELRLVGRVGERQPPGEAAVVRGSELAGVQHDRPYLALRDPDLDTTPGEARIETAIAR